MFRMGFRRDFCGENPARQAITLITLQVHKDLPHAAKQTVICDNG
jgi:hypothetical protein